MEHMEIGRADLDDPRVAEFLSAHLSDMDGTAPQESQHALSLSDYENQAVALFVGTLNGRIVGSVAVKDLGAGLTELKTMRTDPNTRGQGIATKMLNQALTHARALGATTMSLETGIHPFFHPAHKFYLHHGFTQCEPFGTYAADPNSIFMTRALTHDDTQA